MTTLDHAQQGERDGRPTDLGAEDAFSRRKLLIRATAIGAGAAALGRLSAIGASAAPANRLRLLNAAFQNETLAKEQVVRLPESEPLSLDPGITHGARGLEEIQNLFEGLVYLDQRDGSLQMGLAATMTPNADDSEYTFTLRKGLVWSDGTPLDAHDFEWSWKRALDPRSEYATALYPLKGAAAIIRGEKGPDALGVVAVDDTTLRVTLEEPTPYFPLLATTWTFSPVPKHVIDKEGDGWVEAGKMVSNGPYLLTSWEHDQSLVLERNPTYYGQQPVITRATYTLFADDTSQALVPYEDDELDQAQVSFADLDRVKNDPTLSAQMHVYPRSATRFLVCDTTNAPTSDVRFRQALSLAIGRDTLANGVLKGAFSPTQTMLPADIPGHNPAAALGEDLGRARQLLADAGFPTGAHLPKLTLVCHAADLAERTTAQYLQAVWKQNLGLEVTLDPMEEKAFQDWFDSRKDQPFNLMIYQWGSDWGDPANWHNQLFDSRADFYHSHWKDDEFDRLVRAAAVMPDATARIAQYRQAETILVSDAALIPLYNLVRIYVVKPFIRGVYHYPVLSRTWIRYISVVAS
ncbi:MAG TPA: peptide ABC transporter substrate-binding protein [Thermomicrobiales bacterium]